MANKPGAPLAGEVTSSGGAAVEGFFAALAKSHAPTTLLAYRQDIDEYLEWCRQLSILPLSIGPERVQEFVDHLLETVQSRTAGPPVSAVSRKLSALSIFFEYAVESGYVAISPLPGVSIPRFRVERRPGARLSDDDVAKLHHAAMAHSLRAHALVAVLTRTGLRLGEALARDVEDVVVVDGRPVARFHRSARTGVVDVPLSWPTYQAVMQYLGDRDTGPLFTSATGKRMDQSAVFRLLRRVARAAELPQQDEINPQFLREYFVTAALESGEDPERVHAVAGFTHPKSARRYQSTE